MRGLIDGKWQRQGAADEAPVFAQDGYRGWIPSARFPAEAGRYHLYLSYACPFAHRVILAHCLKRLDDLVTMSVCDPHLGGPNGWWFATAGSPSAFADVTSDTVNGCRYLHEIYTLANPTYTGRVTIPVLWDRREQTIVSNDSGDMLRFLNTAFAGLAAPTIDLYPEELQSGIDALNEFIGSEINVGVYRVGMASTQAVYDAAVVRLFDALDRIEARLAHGGPYLLGDRLTEADIRLFVTLIRFETGYAGALYCNLRSLRDYPALWAYTHHIRGLDGVAPTVKYDHYLRHYYDDDVFVNRKRTEDGRFIVPAGPLPST